MTVSTSQQLFEVRRRFKIGGDLVQPGQILDLKAYDLPPGRADQLVRSRYGEYLTKGEPDKPAPVRKPTIYEPNPDPPQAAKTTVEVEKEKQIGEQDDGLSEYVPEKASEFAGMTKRALQAEAVRMGVPVQGTKKQIIDRLLGAGD